MTPEPFVIRPFRRADLDRVMAIERDCYSHPWSGNQFLEEIRNPFSSVDLLWLETELAGYLCSWIVVGELHILNLATAPRYRRRGIAAALLAHAIDRARPQGLVRAFLEVRVSNSAAIDLYRRFGFRPLFRRPGYYPDGEDAFVMEWLNSDADAALPHGAGERKDL
jgi:ribosomal-protein-alanine N-acetyltransferase